MPINQLIECVLRADTVGAKNILDQESISPFEIEEATDFSDRKVRGSALQLSVGCRDQQMFDMLKPYMSHDPQQGLNQLAEMPPTSVMYVKAVIWFNKLVDEELPDSTPQP